MSELQLLNEIMVRWVRVLLFFVAAGGLEASDEVLIRAKVLEYGGKQHSVDDFYLDRTETSLGAYQKIMGPENLPAPRYQYRHGWNRPELPVTGVDWFSAQKYCQALGRRLPRAIELIAAWQGDVKTRFPFGDTVPAQGPFRLPGSQPKGLAPTDAFSRLRSDQGILNLAGNVAEWTGDSVPGAPRKRWVFGGSFADDLPSVQWGGFLKVMDPSEAESEVTGFRCARDGRIQEALVLTQRGMQEEVRKVSEDIRAKAEEQKRQDEQKRMKYLKLFSYEELKRRRELLQTIRVEDGKLHFPVGIHRHGELAFQIPSFQIDRHPSSGSVKWSQAQSDCQKKGGRLPTEWEWERAATGLEGLPANTLVYPGEKSEKTALVFARGPEWMAHPYISKNSSARTYAPTLTVNKSTVFPALRGKPQLYSKKYPVASRHGALRFSSHSFRCVYPGQIHADFKLNAELWTYRGEEFYTRIQRQIEAGEDVFGLDWRSLEFEKMILRREESQSP